MIRSVGNQRVLFRGVVDVDFIKANLEVGRLKQLPAQRCKGCSEDLGM